MEAQQSYVPINCSKCNAQNNAARYTSCRVCGAYLTPAESGANRTPGRSRFGGFWLPGLLLLVVAGGLVFFFYGKSPGGPGGTARQSSGRDAPLPRTSWHNNSWRSWITKYPKPEEVLAQYARINKDSPPFTGTLVVAGKLSQARGKCFTQACSDSAEYGRQVDPATGNMVKVVKPIGLPTPGANPEPAVRDEHASLYFTDLGRLEIVAKAPDRMLKKVIVQQPGTQDSREIRETVLGNYGSRSVISRGETGRAYSTDITKMSDAEVAAAREEVESFSKRDFSEITNPRVVAVEKVNDIAVFVLTATNKKALEETYYFDAVSGQIVKVDTKEASVYFGDFRPSPWGGMYPAAMYYRREEAGGFHSWVKFEVDKWEEGLPIEDSVFQPPAASSPSI